MRRLAPFPNRAIACQTPSGVVAEAIQRRIVWLLVGAHAIKRTLEPISGGAIRTQIPDLDEAVRLADDMITTMSDLCHLLPEELQPTEETLRTFERHSPPAKRGL